MSIKNLKTENVEYSIGFQRPGQTLLVFEGANFYGLEDCCDGIYIAYLGDMLLVAAVPCSGKCDGGAREYLPTDNFNPMMAINVESEEPGKVIISQEFIAVGGLDTMLAKILPAVSALTPVEKSPSPEEDCGRSET